MKRRVLSAFIIILVVVMMLGTISVSAYQYEYDVEIDKLYALVEEAEKFEFDHYNTTALT
jgi:cell division protein FtsL